MDTLNLPTILEKYNKQLFDSLKNEMMNSFKEDLLKDIKTEIYNFFINNKEDNINICGFKRTRQRGYCKRHIKGFVCPYHLQQFKNNSKKFIPDKIPDENLYGTYISTTKNEEYIDMEKIKIYKKELINIKIYDYNKNYLPILKYNLERDINDIKGYCREIDLLYKIEINQSNNCNINGVYKCRIYNKKINIIDNYENNGYSKIKLIEYNIGNSILGSKNKNKNKNKNKKKKKKTIEHLFNIFNDKIKNVISNSKFVKSEKIEIKKIINDNLNKYNSRYKDKTNLYVYDSSVMIFREIEKYIENQIYHDIDYFNNMLRNIFFYYNIFSLLSNEDSLEEDKNKWAPRLENFVINTLGNF